MVLAKEKSKNPKFANKDIWFVFRSNKKLEKVVLYSKNTNNNKVSKLTAKPTKEPPIWAGSSFTSRYVASKGYNKHTNYNPYKYVIYY
jgi:hypothetical protein